MPAVPEPSLLGTLPLFRNLTAEQLSRLNEMLYQQSFPAGTSIFAVAQPAEVVYVILSGTIKIYVAQSSGTSVTIDFGGAGDVLGDMAVIENSGRSASAAAVEDSTLIWISRADFLECLQTMPAMNRNLLRILSGRLRLANERIQALASLDVYGRVARHLLAFATKYGQVAANGDTLIPIRLTQSDISDLVGASRQHVNQVMAFYRQRRYLSVGANYRITVHNSQALAERYR